MRDAKQSSGLEESSNGLGTGSLRGDQKALCSRIGDCMDGRMAGKQRPRQED